MLLSKFILLPRHDEWENKLRHVEIKKSVISYAFFFLATNSVLCLLDSIDEKC